MKRLCLLLILWVSFCGLIGEGIHAQNVEAICQPEIIHYTRQTYQANRQNWAITQSPQTQFLYFANSKGLLEFDGSHWKCYELPLRQTVRSALVSKTGKVFTGALGEFGYWEKDANGTLKYHSLKNLIPDKAFATEEIWHILETKQGIFFQSFAFMYLYQGGKITPVNLPGSVLFLREVAGKLWIPSIGKGLYEYRNEGFAFVKGSEFLGNETVHTLLPLGENNLLIGTNKGLYSYNFVDFKPFNAATNIFIRENQLNVGAKLSDSLYTFGTILNGMVLTDVEGNILQHFHQKNGLQDNTILSFFRDMNANLWVGMDNGIDCVVLSSPIKYFKEPEEKLGQVFTAILYENMLYLGTNRGLFARSMGVKEDKFSLVPNTQGRVLDLQVFDGQLFCGHNSGTLLIKNRQAKSVSPVTGGWVMKKLRQHPDYLIQGTYTKLCIYRKNKATKQWEFSHRVMDFTAPVKQIEETANGDLWLNTTTNGICRVRLSDDLTKVVAQNYFNAPEMYRADLSQVKSQIFVATNKGLLVYQNQRFAQTDWQKKWGKTMAQRLFTPSDSVVLMNKHGGGLAFVQREGLQDLPLKTTPLNDDINLLPIDTKHYLACTQNGFILIPKNDIAPIKSVHLKTLIRSISVENYPSLTQNFTDEHLLPLIFESHQNNLTFRFCTTPNPLEVTYTYWLEGYQKDWSARSSVAHKEFNNLSPGSYILHLKSSLSASESRLAFEILSPWYWTKWSQLVYLGLIGLILTALFRYQQKLHHRKREKLRQTMEEKMRRQAEENHQKLLELRNQQLEQDVIRKSEELANSTMNIIKKNELLDQIQEELVQLPGDWNKKIYHKIHHLIERKLSAEKDWRVFEANFNQVHEEFLKKLLLQYPEMSKGDLKLAAYLRMNLSTKEISEFLNITIESVELKRHRLRKKMQLTPNENLGEALMRV